MGHVHRGRLVADVDDVHPEPRQLVPDRLDVPALQAEHAAHAAFVQELRYPLGDRSGLALAHTRLLTERQASYQT